MAYTSPSGIGTTLKLTLTGEGANPNSMPCANDGASSAPSTQNTAPASPVTPDTGFFTSETSGATPFVIGGVIILLLSVFAITFAITSRSKRRFSFAKNFRVNNPKLALKRTGIFAGVFLIAFLALGAIMPNLLNQTESASALETNNSLSITTGSSSSNNTLSMSTNLSSTPSMAIASETVSITAATTKGYTLYLSTDSDNKNSFYHNNDSCGGYIKPTSGTTTNRTALEANHWGFAVDIDTDTAFKNPASWAAVPKYSDEVIIKQKSSATTAGDSTKVVYGANVNNTIPAGDYYNTVLYTAIAKI